MSTVEGRVVFRNRMGGTSIIKVEASDGIEQLVFKRAILGDQVYDDRVRRLEIDEVIRVETEEPVEHPRGLGQVRHVQRILA